MYKFIQTAAFSALLLFGLASQSAAQSAAGSWQGFRVGLTGNSEMSGEARAYNGGLLTNQADTMGDQGAGAFIGYDTQRGNMVYGVELQALKRDNAIVGFPNSVFENIRSVRGRVGYANNNVLLLGSLGFASSNFNDTGTNFSQDGIVVGIGAEVMMTPRTFVGLGIDHYKLSGSNGAAKIEGDHTLFQIRAGMKF
ncbi:MAG: outer membrane beta-barrel protein [Cognatishimia sp.]|uniref:outer membrane protein n=1 Tax=Cognatishimia sp. TaxID=2211648 RepID=UPI003B8BFEE0